MLPVLETLTAFFSASRAALEKTKQNEALKNTPAVQAAAGAQARQDDLDKGKEAIEKKDINTLRDRWS